MHLYISIYHTIPRTAYRNALYLCRTCESPNRFRSTDLRCFVRIVYKSWQTTPARPHIIITRPVWCTKALARMSSVDTHDTYNTIHTYWFMHFQFYCDRYYLSNPNMLYYSLKKTYTHAILCCFKPCRAVISLLYASIFK